jgi:type I restriction enzyme S subunit
MDSIKLLDLIKNAEVEWKSLGEVAEIGTGSSNAQDADENGIYPFYVRSRDIKKSDNYIFDETAIVIPGEGGVGEIFHFVQGKYNLHQRAYRVHITDGKINPKFVFYYFNLAFKKYILHKAVSATVVSIRKPMLEKFSIPIPSPEIQQKCVEILDKMTDYVTELTAELTLRQKQYSFYRDKLLTFAEDNPQSDSDESLAVRWTTLGEVAKEKLSYGSGAFAIEYDGNARYIRITDINENGGLSEIKMSPDTFDEKYLLKDGDLLFARSGATVGKTYYYVEQDGKAIYAGYLIRYVADKSQVLSKYVYYLTKSSNYNKFVELAKGGGAQPNINAQQYSEFKFQLPPLNLQSKIVEILDKFQALTEDVSGLLPEEIALRQKQYAYYREQLLTFDANNDTVGRSVGRSVGRN